MFEMKKSASPVTSKCSCGRCGGCAAAAARDPRKPSPLPSPAAPSGSTVAPGERRSYTSQLGYQPSPTTDSGVAAATTRAFEPASKRATAAPKRVNVRLRGGILGPQRGGAGGAGGMELSLSGPVDAPGISIGPPRRAAGGWAADLGVMPDGANELGDTGVPPQTSSPMQAPSGGGASCDCCVDSVTISNPARIDNATHMGHSFDVTIAMGYPTSPTASGLGHCVLQWFERTNVPYHPRMVAGAWNDMFALVPGSPTFTPWVNRSERCETSSAVTITDTPMLGKTPGRTVNRTLEFNIVVSSSPTSSPSGCTNAAQSATATQVLDMVAGASNWAASSFVTP